jgi:hypothetical protein
MVNNSRALSAVKKIGRLLAVPVLMAACADSRTPTWRASESAAAGDAFTNANGAARMVSVNGADDRREQSILPEPGNERARVRELPSTSAAMTITPPQIQAVFNATQGLDPLFRLNDRRERSERAGRHARSRRAAYSLVLSKGLIRIPLTLPANRDFDVKVVLDPYAGTARTRLSTRHRADGLADAVVLPAPAAVGEHAFISAVMWDGREATVSPVPANPRDVDGSGIQASQADRAGAHQHAHAVEQRDPRPTPRARSI